LQNHSWGLLVNNNLGNANIILDAVHFANRKNVTVVAARGNDGTNTKYYPSCAYDDWVLNVGGSGNNGCYITTTNGGFNASYGLDLDIAAPASLDLVTTTKNTQLTTSLYRAFSGTSASAPHVSGVVALLMSYMNAAPTANPTDKYLRDLAPEDCEQILQRSAKDDNCVAGYDDYTGFGRLDAGAALKLIEKPNNTLRHFGTNSNSPSSNSKTITLTASNINLDIVEPTFSLIPIFTPYPAGIYKADVYKVNVTVTHNSSLPTDETIVGFWARNSASTAYPVGANILLPFEKINIISCSKTSCVMEGYVYQLKNSAGLAIGWLPSNPNIAAELGFEYSILTKKNNPIGITTIEPSLSNIQLFPNPSTEHQILVLNTKSIAPLKIDLKDITGKTLKTMYNGITESGENKVDLNMKDLPSGIYFYEVKFNNQNQHIRFIKQ
jgi:hypothetical protein